MNYINNIIVDNKIYINQDLYYTIKRIKGRIILIPCEKLKKEQKFFLNAIKWEYPIKFDTLKCAKIHVGKKWILKMDIKDFYESVPSQHIMIVLRQICEHIKFSDVNYYYKITTVNDNLPIGASTSAHLANACFNIVDKDIRKYCDIWEVNYSRYVDDLTFSSDNKYLLNMVEKKVQKILNYYGYKHNKKKTKYISDNKQQNILGLVVNNGYVRLSKEFKRNIRVMLHKYAIFKYNYKHELKLYVSEQQIFGYISYIKHVDIAEYNRLKNYAKKLTDKYCVEFPFFGKFK